MDNGTLGIIIAIIVYLGGMLYIGYRFSKKTETVGEFYLGGRKLGPLAAAMSAEASDMSSWLLMGLPGVAYLTGIADAAWTAIGLALGTYLNWLIIAKRLRQYTEKTNSITVPEFFSNRYHDSGKVLTFIAALVIVIFFVPYTASGFAACGKLFSSLFGADYHVAMILSAIVIVTYTALGGFMAVSVTDLIQSIVMTIALVVILAFGVHSAGGLAAVGENAKSLAGYLSLTAIHDSASGTAAPYSFLTIVSTMAWGLGYFGMPHILLRFMAIEDENKLQISRRVGSIWVVISMAVSVFIGIVGYAASNAGAIPFLSGSDSETVIVQFASLMSKSGLLAALIAGIVLAGILASTMSTADSQLLTASSAVSKDLADVFHVKIDTKKTLQISRLTLIVVSLIGVFFAWDSTSSVFKIVSFAWAGFGASFGPVVLLALFWKRSNFQGALAGMVSGGVMIFVWKFLVRPLGGVLDIYELLPAFVIALVVNIVVSLLTPAPEQSVLDTFDSIGK
ncbi:MAG: sodium/proline symporter [Solobacterium sp.]|nr:sodium/proline symporter [Solobacterium sp.]